MKLVHFCFVFASTFLFFCSICEFYGQKIKKNKQNADFLTVTDEIILNQRAGMSFHHAIKNLSNKGAFPSENNKIKLSAEQKQFVEIIQFCTNQPTLSFKILETYRQRLRIQKRLQEKQKTISTQSKAQGLVSLLLYFLIFFFQITFYPDFLLVFRCFLGKVLLLISFFLILAGNYVVFAMARPPRGGIL